MERVKFNRLFLGTNNPNKVREYKHIVASEFPWLELVVSSVIDPEETEPDLDGNAILKARAHARAAGGVTLSEDAGLVVPFLHGLPGAFSARFADCEVEPSTGRVIAHRDSGDSREVLSQRNIARILDLLRDADPTARRAYFACVIVVASPDGTVLFKTRGECHGQLTLTPRGTGGFGYDPIFQSDEAGGLTFGEASEQTKHSHSHRALALRQLAQWLRSQAD